MSIIENIFSSKIRTMVIRVLLFTLVIEALIWGIVILVDDSSSSLSYYASSLSLTTKLQLVFWVIAGLLTSAVFGSWSAVKGDQFAKVLALVGICFSVIAAILQFLLIFGVVPMYEASSDLYSLSFGGPSMVLKIMTTCFVTAVTAIVLSLVVCIDENGDMIMPSKVVAIVCGLSFWVCMIFVIFAGTSGDVAMLVTKALPLAGMMMSCFAISTGVAVVLSWSNRRDKIDKLLAGPVKEASETYQKVLDIQDEERARLAKEKAKLDAMPPLQSEDMAPTVSHDGEVKVDSGMPEAQPENQSDSGSNTEVL
ncbi:hypothetical protein IKF28_02530 [Candidatus Saccharibacteria bacterium]|nr:hypothetical protein [Candidatus Saccharibacteria bacterium]